MRMNSSEGKQILALVREGDYAHPGEERAIDLVFSTLPKDAAREVLDIGCGRGGTAEYVRKHCWGNVTGVDIDEDSLVYARGRYPGVEFVYPDVASIGGLWRERFDHIYLFNSFYAFPDQRRALHEMCIAARENAILTIFEYTDVDGAFRQSVGEKLAFWKPIELRRFPQELEGTGWIFVRSEDISSHYLTWYRDLCFRIEARKERIVNTHGQDWYDYVYATYADLLSLVERKIVGGTIVWARRG